MRRYLIWLAVPLLLGALVIAKVYRVEAQGVGSVISMDPAFDRIAPAGAQIEKLAGKYQTAEGPLWDPAGRLLFSDIGFDQIRQWTPDGKVTTFRRPSGNSNGLTFDRQGRLIACEQGNRRVSRTEKDGTIVALADRYDGKRLNSPNDVVVRADGSIYFTDPPFYIDSSDQQLPFQGVYRLAPDGKLTLLADDFDRPNGLAFSPDERTLYVDDTSRAHIRAFDVGADGTLANGRVFAVLKSSGDGWPDGMKVDTEGNIYCTGQGGIWVLTPAGKHLGTIRPPETTLNVGWGDADYKTLYITTLTGLYRIRLNIPGIRP